MKTACIIINLQATDHGSPPLNTTSNINVLVEDVNDNTPVFTQMTDSYNVKESNSPFEVGAKLNFTSTRGKKTVTACVYRIIMHAIGLCVNNKRQVKYLPSE